MSQQTTRRQFLQGSAAAAAAPFIVPRAIFPHGMGMAPEEFAVGHGRMRKLLEKYGAKDLPILNTERGFAAKKTGEGWSGGSAGRARTIGRIIRRATGRPTGWRARSF